MLFHVILTTLAIGGAGDAPPATTVNPIPFYDITPSECRDIERRWTRESTQRLGDHEVRTRVRAKCEPADAEARAAVRAEAGPAAPEVYGPGPNPCPVYKDRLSPCVGRDTPPPPPPPVAQAPAYYADPAPPPVYFEYEPAPLPRPVFHPYYDPRSEFDGLPPVTDSDGVPRPRGSYAPPPYDPADPYLRSPDPWEREAACRARRPQC